ncbi:MAG: response regulator [Candidatus Scalindua sp.]|nr:response regulator [Candidatus Scalindua sp.]
MDINSYEQQKAAVMVIDDDDSVLKTTTLILEEEGYQIEAFSTGKEAIDTFNNNIHVVVLDINMPDMTGLQVFKKIKSINPYVPIIFHTGAAVRQDERRNLRRQFRPHAYVQKGDPEQLMDTVVSAVESYGNILRNVKLSESLYKELKKSTDKIKTNIEGTIHDIGKMQVPTEILSKCGKLTKLEFDMIKTHSQAGYDILKTIEFQWPIAEFVLQHHERMDGSGYPSGLKGESILIEARILSVADVVDAIVPHRPYRPALGIEKAQEEILDNRGIVYDSNVVDACLSIISENNVWT